jgi:glucuronate isomerase
VAASGRDPAWAPAVLRDRCNIRARVTSLGNKSDDPARNPDDVYFMLDAHYLFCPGVATDLDPFFTGRTRKAEYYEALRALFGEAPASAAHLERLLGDWLDRTVTGRVRFTNTFLPDRAAVPSPRRVARQRRAGPLRRRLAADRRRRRSPGPVRLLADPGLAPRTAQGVQIAVGAEYFICDGKSIPRFQETWTSQMARAFHHFGGARFDLMMASDVLSHEVAVLARQFPNVYASGYWWHNFFPATIERIIGLRVQVAPMTKVGGFLSDAYYAEWAYGKLQVVKKAMAAAFAHLVVSGFYEEDEVPPILRQILHDTPRDLYDLHD